VTERPNASCKGACDRDGEEKRSSASMGSAVSVCPSGWVGLVLFRPVLERPTTGPVEKTGCWLRRCCCFFFFFFLETSTASTKALRPERAVVRRDSLPLPRSVREERLSQRGDETSELDVGGEDAGDRTANEPGQEQDRRSVRNGGGSALSGC